MAKRKERETDWCLDNLVRRVFSLAWGRGAPPPSQGKVPGNEVELKWSEEVTKKEEESGNY